MRIDLTGKTALVTGGAGELGRAIVRILAKCGANVALHYFRSAERAAQLEAELCGAGTRCAAFPADLTLAAEVQRLRDAVVQRLGAPDILVLNAVSQFEWQPLLKQSPDAYVDQFRSCVMQAVHVVQAFGPALVERRAGRIIAINTECAMTCLPSESAYASAKRGLDGVMRALARELGPHEITVNQVAPGWMISDRYRAAGTERQPDYERQVPLGHRGEDLDIGYAVAFLASDLARFITGVYLPVCGGRVLPGI